MFFITFSAGSVSSSKAKSHDLLLYDVTSMGLSRDNSFNFKLWSWNDCV